MKDVELQDSRIMLIPFPIKLKIIAELVLRVMLIAHHMVLSSKGIPTVRDVFYKVGVVQALIHHFVNVLGVVVHVLDVHNVSELLGETYWGFLGIIPAICTVAARYIEHIPGYAKGVLDFAGGVLRRWTWWYGLGARIVVRTLV